jgi:hypothetical protein
LLKPSVNLAPVKRLYRLIHKIAPIFRILTLVAIALMAIEQGLRLRSWYYSATEDFHYRYDAINAWLQGSYVYFDAALLQHDSKPPRWGPFWKCYLHRYDKVMSQYPSGQYDLDYPPGRLLIMSLWVKTKMPNFVPILSDPAGDRFVRPLLWTDSAAEFLAACFAFLVVRCVLLRQQHPWAVPLALLSAILLWFDPSVLTDRLWPQWDAWCLPFYLLAAFLALKRCWLAAGACIGAGLMFKGQVICTAAVFVLWPLFQGRFRAALEVVIGAFLGLMICVSPFLIRTPLAVISLVLLMVGAGFGARYVSRNWRVNLIAASLAIALFLSGLLFHGSFGWWWVAFAFSSHHFMQLSLGGPTNLATLLARRGHWKLLDVLYANDRWHLSITMRAALVSLYGLTLTACAFGIARQDRRNDRRVLLALATPWLLFFAFMPQLHERYLYWGGALTALAAGVSLGTTLLHLAISLLSSFTMLAFLLRNGTTPFAHFVQGVCPDSAWAVILITLIFLFLSIAPGPESSFRKRADDVNFANPS